MVEIYGLYDPETNALRYVGKANDSKDRLRRHLREWRRRSPLYSWIGALAKRGLKPVVKVLSIVPESEWEHEERRQIFEARLTNTKLLNLADGGDQPKATREQCSKNGKTVAERRRTDENFDREIRMKQLFRSLIRDGLIKNETRIALMQAAKRYPKEFGYFKTIPLK